VYCRGWITCNERLIFIYAGITQLIASLADSISLCINLELFAHIFSYGKNLLEYTNLKLYFIASMFLQMLILNTFV